MTQRKHGPFPHKKSAPEPGPLTQAITRNRRPLLAMGVGVMGIAALVLFNTWGETDTPAGAAPLASETVAEPSRSVATPAPIASTAVVTQPAPSEAAPADSVTAETAVVDAAAQAQDPAPSPQNIAAEADPVAPYIVLILDDIGNNSELGQRAVSLPGAVTYAVLPHTPHAVSLAEQAHSLGKEVMLHAPMSNQAHFPLGPGALTGELSHEEFMQTLEDSIASIPHLQGINNHMGSTLTEQETPMTWVMDALREHSLYFVDSLTTPKSVAGRVAREHNIPTITRNVFLDNEITFENIDGEFQRLLTLAEKNGSAVGIGHPYVQTLEYLEQALPRLAERNIDLVSVSTMIARQKKEQATAATTAAW